MANIYGITSPKDDKKKRKQLELKQRAEAPTVPNTGLGGAYEKYITGLEAKANPAAVQAGGPPVVGGSGTIDTLPPGARRTDSGVGAGIAPQDLQTPTDNERMLKFLKEKNDSRSGYFDPLKKDIADIRDGKGLRGIFERAGDRTLEDINILKATGVGIVEGDKAREAYQAGQAPAGGEPPVVGQNMFDVAAGEIQPELAAQEEIDNADAVSDAVANQAPVLGDEIVDDSVPGPKEVAKAVAKAVKTGKDPKLFNRASPETKARFEIEKEMFRQGIKTNNAKQAYRRSIGQIEMNARVAQERNKMRAKEIEAPGEVAKIKAAADMAVAKVGESVQKMRNEGKAVEAEMVKDASIMGSLLKSGMVKGSDENGEPTETFDRAQFDEAANAAGLKGKETAKIGNVLQAFAETMALEDGPQKDAQIKFLNENYGDVSNKLLG